MKATHMKLYKILFIPFFLMCVTIATGQQDLKQIEDETALIIGELGGSKNKVKRATLTKEDERMVTVSLSFEGFDDKPYQVKAAVMNAQKKIVEEISRFTSDIPKSKQVDVTLNLSEPGKTLSSSAFETKYLLIRTAPKGTGLDALLEGALGDVNISGTDYVFELNKKWMAMGANVKVTVNLTPYKSAASITPN
jgi:hypothetical protein